MALLLLIGMACCAGAWRTYARTAAASPALHALLIAAAVAAAVVVLPAGVGASYGRLEKAVRHPTPAGRRWVTIAIWSFSTLYLAATAYFHARDLFPRIHDEASYTIGARMLARGRLWMPAHPGADFFESFHLLVRPVYASIYFPGTALLNVPGIWLGLPSWVVPVIIAGLAAAMAYRVTCELVDGVAGLLAALLIVANPLFRTYSTMVMAQTPAMLLGLLTLWAYLGWRRHRRLRWAAAMGAFAGWAAITRPVDAIAFTAPVGVALLLDLWRAWRRGAAVGEAGAALGSTAAAAGGSSGAKRGAAGPRRGVRLLLIPLTAMAGAAPFLMLQAAFNLGVTGHPLRSAYELYVKQNHPGTTFAVGGIGAKAAPARPATALRQKQIYFDELVANETAMRGQGWGRWLGLRLAGTAAAALQSPWLLALLPLGLASCGRRRWTLGAVVPLFVGLYLANPLYFPHHALPLAAPAAFCAVVGGQALVEALAAGRPRLRRYGSAALILAVCLIAWSGLPEVNSAVNDERYRTPLLDAVVQALVDLPPPAVVLFRFHPGSSVHEEPVYNITSAWPDDAPIIRAHDLGERNAELFRYYARRQPDRVFYRIDRGDLLWTGGGSPTLRVVRLGTAAELARRADAADASPAQPASPPPP